MTAVVADHECIERAWRDRPGLLGFFTTVDHKRLGIRYIVTSFFFFFVAGLLALVMRAQLARPNGDVVSPDAYNQLFTMHGTLMIFLFNTPVLAGFGNYLVPLLIGARDMAFPRLNTFSYWIFVGAGIFMSASMVIGKAPDGGWFAYVPLTGKAASPGINLDFWGLGVIFVGISTTAGAVNFLVTAFKLRAPGMTVNRIPILVWSYVAMAFMILFAVPAITVSAALLEADRLFDTKFYVVGAGGNALLYQHLFWFWGHPEVYILFLPAVGMVTTIITTFARRPLAGYLWQVAALIGIAFISFGVWVHHMFATGLPTTAMGFFSAASFVIAIPSAVLYFSWIGTMWGGRVRFTAPMLFALGFLLIFLIGGITGVMVASLPFDLQVTDSYFIVAHFHYVLNGAVVFPIFGAVYYWMPKMTGRLLSDRLGRWSFWTMLVGFNVTFGPMHVLGELGMARRISTYGNGLGWDTLNMIVSLGSLVFAAGTLLTVGNVAWSLRHGRVAPADPWGADTLEWSIPSPAPEHNFTTIPVVASRHPLWQLDEDGEAIDGPAGPQHRGTPITGGLDTEHEDELVVPQPTALPALAALGVLVFFVGLLISATVVLVLGGVIGLAGLVTWGWRTDLDHPEVAPVSTLSPVSTVVLGPQDRSRRAGWWGMVLLIVTEAMIFAALLSASFFVRANSPSWPPAGIEPPDLGRIGVFTLVLLASSVPLLWGEAAIRRGQVGRLRVGLAVSWLLGAVFVVNQLLEFRDLPFRATDDAYASLFIVITGLHGLHLIVGLAMSVVVQLKAALGWFDARRHETVTLFSMYWHFVDVVWVFVFAALYVSVRW